MKLVMWLSICMLVLCVASMVAMVSTDVVEHLTATTQDRMFAGFLVLTLLWGYIGMTTGNALYQETKSKSHGN